jgi:hypothetical protein
MSELKRQGVEIMKRMFVVLMVVLAFSQVGLWAQDAPKAQVFGGFSVASFDGPSRTQAPGWQASLAGNLNETMGLVADFGGQYKNGGHAYEYLFGPRFNSRMEKATLFGHALLGGVTVGSSGVSQSGFGMGYGGGIDLRAGENLGVRLVQIDWLPTRMAGTWETGTVRFGFGFVFGR